MTPTLRLAAAACLFALPAFAQTQTAESKITSVTVYGNGAMVTRQVSLDLPAGVSEVIIPDIPKGSEYSDAESFLASLQVNAPDGVAIVAISTAQDLPASVERQSGAAIQAAQAEVDRLDAKVRESAANVDAIRFLFGGGNIASGTFILNGTSFQARPFPPIIHEILKAGGLVPFISRKTI
jgi:hypothetical protein